MDSSERRNDVIAPNSSDSAPLQDSTYTIFGHISDLSPIKPSKGAVVAQSFPQLGSPSQGFASPQINPQSQPSSLKRPQYHHISSEYAKQYDDKNDDIAPIMCTPGNLNYDLSYQVNSHGVGHSSNGSAHGKGSITSQYVDEYMEDLLRGYSDDARHASNSSLKQSDLAAPSFKDFADCIKGMNGEQNNVLVRTEELQESTQTSQLHTCGEEPAEVISTDQNALLHDCEVSQQMSGTPRRCLQYNVSQENAVVKICGSSSQSNAASILRSFSSKFEVLESYSAAVYEPPNNLEPENCYKPILSTLHAPKFRRSSLAVSKPSGVGLHLNSIVSTLPMGCGASLKLDDKDFIIVHGKKSLSTTDSHSAENAGNSLTSSEAVDGLLKTSEHHSTACDKSEYTKLNPQKKRNRSAGSSDGDGGKCCNCKKSKCLKLYCDCFASGYYCAQTCSCQGCFNTPEYEDAVLETRRQIVSRDPLAFSPKILQRVGESAANNIQDINKSTSSSSRHKRGCNCKKSKCLKRYCECYQSNIGCSDGCRCAGCENVYGKKEEFASSKYVAIKEATNNIPDIPFDQKLDTLLQYEPCIPHNMTNDISSQPCPESGSFSLLSSSQLPCPPTASVVPSGENKLHMVLDSESSCYNILEDELINLIIYFLLSLDVIWF